MKYLTINFRLGFTLIEISIVLIIIGLVLGGVLAGRDLITVSERRSTLAQLDEINNAVHVFKLKYGCIPGDCPSSVDPGVTQGGDNDGILELWGTEVSKFFTALWASSLLPKKNSRMSLVQDTKLSGGFRTSIWFVYNSSQSNISPKDTKHRLWIAYQGFIGSMPPDFHNVAALHPSEAYWFDQKIDDGYAQLGRVLAASDYYDSTTAAAVPTLPTPDPMADICIQEINGDQYDTYSMQSSGAFGDALCSLILPTTF